MSENQILKRLAQSNTGFFQGRLKPLSFGRGDILAESGDPVDRLIFPESGLVSLLVQLEDGHQIESAMTGPRGAVGGAAVFGAETHLSIAVAQLPGRAWTIRVEDARQLASNSGQFSALLVAHERYLLAQAQRTAACNARHLIEQRLCSWLLRANHEVGEGDLLITQESLAKMLGVQRASVSTIASELQDKELLQYRRGRVRIMDANGLAARACDCHSALRQQYESLFTSETAVRAGADGAARSATEV